jgi:hypothetical protein
MNITFDLDKLKVLTNSWGQSVTIGNITANAATVLPGSIPSNHEAALASGLMPSPTCVMVPAPDTSLKACSGPLSNIQFPQH